MTFVLGIGVEIGGGGGGDGREDFADHVLPELLPGLSLDGAGSRRLIRIGNGV
jgi:hypothetical protein